ncbi:MAG: hypothetical protein IV085_12330 [Thiobacillus sp.]|nr:hypothetical protein [Thiobacillus sp.]
MPWLQVEGASLAMQNPVLAPRGGGSLKNSDSLRAEALAEANVPVLEFVEARARDANPDLAKRHVKLAGVSMTGARLGATRDVKGLLNWQTLLAVADERAAPKSKAAAPGALRNIDVRATIALDVGPVNAALESSGGNTPVTLDKDKSLNSADILKKALGAPAAAPAKADAATVSPLGIHLVRLSLNGLEVDVVDQSPHAPVRLNVANGFVTRQTSAGT